jgi:hypothetical protein
MNREVQVAQDHFGLLIKTAPERGGELPARNDGSPALNG